MKKIKQIYCRVSILFILILAITPNISAAETWFFDFGSASQTTLSNYNNITYQGIQTTTGLINADGFTTGLSLEISIPFNQGSTNSKDTVTPAASTGFLPNATRDSFFGNTRAFLGSVAPKSQLVLSGLDPTLVYDITIFSSRMEVSDNRQTEYKVMGINTGTAYLDATNNQSEVATISAIQPSAQGKITLDVAAGPDNNNADGFFYLGAMKLVSRQIVPETCGSDDPTLDNKFTKYPFVYGDASSPYKMGHLLYRPAGYSNSPCKKYPLLVWLHGLGEVCKMPTATMTPVEVANLALASLDFLNRASGNSPSYQVRTGSAYTNQRPFLDGIILQPQICPPDGGWKPNNIDLIIEYIKTQLRVDEERIYVTGLSLGGGGTWAYAAGQSKKVAAIVPIAGTQLGNKLPADGGVQTANKAIEQASHVPTWAFHNYHDTNVGTGLLPATELFRCVTHTHRQCTIEHIDRMIPFATTRLMKGYSPNDGATAATTDRTAILIKTLAADLLPTQWLWSDGVAPQDLSAKTIVTLFSVSAGGGHQGWAVAYGMQEMWQWLYAQRLQPAPTLKISSSLIVPAKAALTSGATVNLSAKVTIGAVAVAQVVADLKSLGGSHIAPLTYDGLANVYKLSHNLPVSGLTVGTKPVAVVAVDVNGNRTVKYVTFKIE